MTTLVTYKNWILTKKANKITKVRMADITTLEDLGLTKSDQVELHINTQWLSQSNRNKMNDIMTGKNIKWIMNSLWMPKASEFKEETHWQNILEYKPKRAAILEMKEEHKKALVKLIGAYNKQTLRKVISSIQEPK